MTYIYGLVDPQDHRLRYIGKADNPKKRLEAHLRNKEPGIRTRWISKLKSGGLVPQMLIIDEVPRSDWKFWERFYIARYRFLRCDLLNITEGGNGLGTHTKEAHRKMSESKKGNKNALGHKHSEESRRNMSEIKMGKIKSLETRHRMSEAQKGNKKFLGHKHSEETLRKIGLAHKGKTISEEQRRKIGLVHKGKTISEETRRKMSVAHKGKAHSDETRRKIGDANRGKTLGRKHSEEHRRKLSDVGKWGKRDRRAK